MTIRRIAISGHRNIRRQLGTLDMSVSMARALPALKPLRRRARRHSKSLI
jgi:hypothetical protein